MSHIVKYKILKYWLYKLEVLAWAWVKTLLCVPKVIFPTKKVWYVQYFLAFLFLTKHLLVDVEENIKKYKVETFCLIPMGMESLVIPRLLQLKKNISTITICVCPVKGFYNQNFKHMFDKFYFCLNLVLFLEKTQKKYQIFKLKKIRAWK